MVQDAVQQGRTAVIGPDGELDYADQVRPEDTGEPKRETLPGQPPAGGLAVTRLRALTTTAAAALLAATALFACTSTDPGPGSAETQPMAIGSDPDLDKKIDDLRATGGSAPLRELTAFSWDTVYCFYDGASAGEVNAAVGATVLKPGSYLLVSGALAVFVADGTVVKPLVIRELIFDGNVFPATVVVERGVGLAPTTDPGVDACVVGPRSVPSRQRAPNTATAAQCGVGAAALVGLRYEPGGDQ